MKEEKKLYFIDSLPNINEVKDEAIPLISFDTLNKQFFLNENAENILSTLEGPIGVISVAGMYRTGKSYLMNRMLLNRGNGFSVGPSINPCTKGLWIWSKPLSGYSPEGNPLNVLIIDTEGIGATDEDQNHDSKIFTLGLLLSSYFVYNSLNSIDENAIQNLSFIVNISKNIQLSTKNEVLDPKDYSVYLPSFLWVIRDFSLRLVNTDGETITSKEYLERSLEVQKGFSDSVDQKNKIRNLLKDFFKERDCITLVRPLTDEDNLQNLERMELSQLRPEFSEQVNNLRKKVLHRIKPKTLNGQVLNGDMFCSMIKSYIQAINQGAVPVIENAWGFMCKNECLKAMKNSINIYEKYITENLIKKIPQDQVELKRIHKEAKYKALDNFNRFAIGNFTQEYLKKLNDDLKEKYLQYIIQNEKETDKLCNAFLIKTYQDIEKNIKQGSYKYIGDYNIDVEDFINFYIDKAPRGPNRENYLYTFILKRIMEASEIFIKQSQSESEIISFNNSENIKKLNDELCELKSEIEKEISVKNNTIRKFEKENIDLICSEKSNKENLALLEKEKEQLNKNLSEKLENLKKDSEKQIKELKEKLIQVEESLQGSDRLISNKESDFLKTRLLLDQKLKFSDKNIEDLQNKEKELMNEIKILKKDRDLFSKDSKDKYEIQIKNLTLKFEELQDKNIDLETKLLDKEKRSVIEKKKQEENICDLKKKIEDFNIIISSTEDELKIKEKRLLDEFEKTKIEYEFKIQEHVNKIDELETKLKEAEEKFNNIKTKTSKEISILNQNLELINSTFNEFKNQAEEEKNTLQAMMRLLEDKNQISIKSQEDYIKQINELKNSYFREIKSIEEENEKMRNRLNQEIEDLRNKFYKLENENNFEKENFQKINFSNEEKINKLENLKNNFEEKINLLESEKNKNEDESKKNYDNLFENSHNKIEDILKNTRMEIEENNFKNEKLVSEMQKYFEAEKINCELKLKEEKEKLSKKLKDQEIFYKEKFNEIEESKNKKIEELEEELEKLENNYNDYADNMEQDVSLKNQQIEDLTKFLNDQKENFAYLQSSQKISLQTQMEYHNKEKNSLLEKIDNLNNNLNKKEKENSILTVKKEYLEEDIKKLEANTEILKSDFDLEKNKLNEKVKSFESKYQNLYDKLLIKTGEFTREVALKSQEIEFLDKKLKEIQNYIEILNTKNEENFKSYKENLENEYSEKINNLTKLKEDLENKLLFKKREFKELENEYIKDKSLLDKEKAVLYEKLSELNKLKDEFVDSLEKERELHKKQIFEIKENNKAEPGGASKVRVSRPRPEL